MRQAVIVQQTKQVASDVVQTAAEKTAQGKEAVAQLLQKVLSPIMLTCTKTVVLRCLILYTHDKKENYRYTKFGFIYIIIPWQLRHMFVE
jgi:hypothetical protein